MFLRFCPCNWGTRKREDAAPKASVCFFGGAQEIFDGVSEDLLGGAGKAEDAKLPGAGIIPKLCPMERVETETVDQNAINSRKRWSIGRYPMQSYAIGGTSNPLVGNGFIA